MQEKNAENKMRNKRMQIPQSLIARFLSEMTHHFCQICNFLKCFSVSFNMIFSENLGNNVMLV